MTTDRKSPPPLYVMTSLSRGIERVTEYEILEGGYLFYRSGKGHGKAAPKTAYFLNPEDAQVRANTLRRSRIASLRRRVEAEEALAGKPVPVVDA